MRNLLEEYPLLTLNVGMSNGGEVRVYQWRHYGVRLLGKFPLPFQSRWGGKAYTSKGLRDFWTLGRPELGGRSLLSIIKNGNKGFGFTYFGADVALLNGECVPFAAINYTTTNDDQAYCSWVDAIDDEWWHIEFGGASKAAYQPLAQLKFLHSELPGSTWNQTAQIVPVTDYLFFRLTGEQGHDSIMCQSQGLLGPKSRAVLEKLDAGLPENCLCPWQVYPPTTALLIGGVYYVPGSHDSPFARIVGFSAAPYVIWSGTWVGVAADIEGTEVVPCKETLEAGLSFEGTAIQKNTAQFGPVYKVLVSRAGMDYSQAAVCILEQRDLPELDRSRIDVSAGGAADAANYVLDQVEKKGSHNILKRALAAVINCAVEAVWEDLQRLALVTKTPLNEVSVVGGWSENEGFHALLERKGVQVKIAPHATNAADAGLVAHMLYRITEAEGVPQTVAQILPQLPPLEEEG
jgi:hypothetical protein